MQIGVIRALLWSLAWGWGVQANVWWLGLCDPAGHRPNEQCRPTFPWNHHPQEASRSGWCNVTWVAIISKRHTRPRGRPQPQRSHYVTWMVWKHLGVLPEELEELSGEREVWASLLRIFYCSDFCPHKLVMDKREKMERLKVTECHTNTAPMSNRKDNHLSSNESSYGSELPPYIFSLWSQWKCHSRWQKKKNYLFAGWIWMRNYTQFRLIKLSPEVCVSTILWV